MFTAAGQLVALASVPTPTTYPRPGWAEHDADALWRAAAQAMRQAIGQLPQADDARRIAGVAVASMGEAGVLLDAHGAPLSEVIAWFDRRTQPQVEWLERTIGKDRLAAITGVTLQPIFGLCKLLWLKEHRPDAWARAAVWLNVGDYLAYRLCGVPATDFSMASRMLTLDLHARRWSDEILAAAGIPPARLAQLVPSGARLGPVSAEAGRETGLPSTACVAGGGHDHDCGALAVGVTEPGAVLDSLGTAEALFVPLDRPIAGPALARQGYAQGAHVVPGRSYVHGGLYTSGASVEWVRRLLQAPEGQQGDDAQAREVLIREAAQVPAGSLGTYFVPHLRLANPPRDDPRARGAFVGLTADVTRPTLFRAVLEGLAYESRLSLAALLAYPGVAPMGRLIAIGGSTRNELFMSIKASVLGQSVTIAEVAEATSLGAAMLGGLGAGVYAGVPDALRQVQVPTHVVDPLPDDVVAYEARYQQVYRAIYPALRDLHHAVDRLEGNQ